MSLEKNLNECNGCLIIDNDQNISRPSNGKSSVYDINFEKPCFFVNNHYISPILKCYSVRLPNPVSLISNDKISVKIKIPTNIFGEKYGYSLEKLSNDISTTIKGSIRLKSSNGCDNHELAYNTEDKRITITDYCGWIIIDLSYTLEKEICNLCEISYSFCFDPVKIKVLYGVCKDHDEENIEFPIETCLVLNAAGNAV